MCCSCASHFQFLENISALKTQIFQIFIPKTPQFSRKIHSLEPTFGNLCGTHPPKKKLSAPPPASNHMVDIDCGYFITSPRLQTYPSPASCLVFLLGTYPLGSQHGIWISSHVFGWVLFLYCTLIRLPALLPQMRPWIIFALWVLRMRPTTGLPYELVSGLSLKVKITSLL